MLTRYIYNQGGYLQRACTTSIVGMKMYEILVFLVEKDTTEYFKRF